MLRRVPAYVSVHATQVSPTFFLLTGSIHFRSIRKPFPLYKKTTGNNWFEKGAPLSHETPLFILEQLATIDLLDRSYGMHLPQSGTPNGFSFDWVVASFADM